MYNLFQGLCLSHVWFNCGKHAVIIVPVVPIYTKQKDYIPKVYLYLIHMKGVQILISQKGYKVVCSYSVIN